MAPPVDTADSPAGRQLALARGWRPGWGIAHIDLHRLVLDGLIRVRSFCLVRSKNWRGAA